MSPKLKKKKSAAARARAAFDPKPPPAASDALPQQRERSVVEEGRPPPVRLLSAKEVLLKVNISWPTLWAWSKCGKFPAPRQISPKRIAWLEHEIDAWINALPVRQLPLKESDETA